MIRKSLVPQQLLRRFGKASVDFMCGCVAFVLPLLLAQNSIPPMRMWELVLLTVSVGLIVALCNGVGGAYKTLWHYAGTKEGVTLATSAGIVLLYIGALVASGVLRLPREDVLLVGLLSYLLCSLARLVRKLQVTARKRRMRSLRAVSGQLRHRRVLIVGAGDVGRTAQQELGASGPALTVVGFLDDDQSKHGTDIGGVPVLGHVAMAFDVVNQHDVTEVIIAMPMADVERVRGLVRRMEDAGVRVRALPGIDRLVTSHEVHRPGVISVRDLIAEWNPDRDSCPRDKHVLVTGGAGFIGSHLTRMLLERGYNVRVLDACAYGSDGLASVMDHPNLEIMYGDVTRIRDVSRAMRDVDGVIALAAVVGDPACNVDVEETINLNYSATKVLTEAADFYGVRRLVFASSCSVYGASADESEMLTERSRLNPVSLYARTRLLSENLIFDRCGDVEPVVLRLATVFGLSPRMRFDLVVNTLTARAVVDGSISIFGGNQWRPNVHCQDVARAFIAALEAPASLVAGEIFNVGGDTENYRIEEMGRMVAEIVGDVEISIQDEVPDPRNYRVSFAKIHDVLGFTPLYSVSDGIREVAAAIRASATLRDYARPEYHNVHALTNLLLEAERESVDQARLVVR